MPPGVSPLVLAPAVKMSEYSDVTGIGPSYSQVSPGLFAGPLSHLPVTQASQRGVPPRRDRQPESLRPFTMQERVAAGRRSAITLPRGPCGDRSRSPSRQLPRAYRACQDPKRSCQMPTTSTLGWQHPLNVSCAHFPFPPSACRNQHRDLLRMPTQPTSPFDPCLTCRVSVLCVRWAMASFRHFE